MDSKNQGRTLPFLRVGEGFRVFWANVSGFLGLSFAMLRNFTLFYVVYAILRYIMLFYVILSNFTLIFDSMISYLKSLDQQQKRLPIETNSPSLSATLEGGNAQSAERRREENNKQ